MRSVDPFEARFSVRLNGESLSLTVDEELHVVDETRADVDDPA